MPDPILQRMVGPLIALTLLLSCWGSPMHPSTGNHHDNLLPEHPFHRDESHILEAPSSPFHQFGLSHASSSYHSASPDNDLHAFLSTLPDYNLSNSLPQSPLTSHAHLESGTSNEGKEEGATYSSWTGSENWQEKYLKDIHHLFAAIERQPGVNIKVIWRNFQEYGTSEDAVDLLSMDVNRIRSVIVKYDNPRYKPPGKRMIYLGEQRDPITTRFQLHHQLGRTQAIGLLNRRLTQKTADLLLNPDTFEEGANELRPVKRLKSIKDGSSRLSDWRTKHKNLFKKHFDALKNHSRLALLGGGMKDRIENKNNDIAAATSRGSNNFMMDDSAKSSDILLQDSDTTPPKSSRRDSVIPTAFLPLVPRMMTVYLRHIPSSERSARRYIKEAISNDPSLIKGLLSDKVEEQLAALAHFGRPKLGAPRQLSPLDGLDKIQIGRLVKVLRKAGYSSDKNARRVLRLLVTPADVEQLKIPGQFDEVVSGILSRSFKGKRIFKNRIATTI